MPNPDDVRIELVVAIGRNGVIGAQGTLPWRLSTDLKRFKTITMGCPVIMGRKTFESIGKPLPGRSNIVMTRDSLFDAPAVEVADSFDKALASARDRAISAGLDRVCVIGGGEVYAQALPRAHCLHVTHVEAEPDGDTVFPPIDSALWQVESELDTPAGPRDSAATRYVVYRRRES